MKRYQPDLSMFQFISITSPKVRWVLNKNIPLLGPDTAKYWSPSFNLSTQFSSYFQGGKEGGREGGREEALCLLLEVAHLAHRIIRRSLNGHLLVPD